MTKIIRVNLTNPHISEESITNGHPLEFFAGKSLIAKIISEEVPPKSDALAAENKFIISSGFLGGTPAPNSGRASIGGKSPLTFGIKEANVGGKAPALLGRQDIRGIIFEGVSDTWVIAKIQRGKASLVDAEEFQGLNNYDLVSKLREKFGSRIGIFSIGTAGEKQLKAASVACMDLQGYPSRHAGRGGLGAIMGSKKLKAVVVVPPSGSKIQYQDPSMFKQVAKKWGKELYQQKREFSKFGTLMGLMTMNEVHGLPTQNFRRGQYQNALDISAETLHHYLQNNEGKYGVPCSPGCVIQCSNIVKNPHGQHITSSLEYETVAMNGSNLLIKDITKIAEIDHACDDVGVDTIEIGNALGVLMETEHIKWGDADRALELIYGITQDNPLSLILGDGAKNVGKHFNIDRVAQAKGQGFAAYDPRSFKGMGVTYVTSPMGADHTAGSCIVGRKPYQDQDYGKLYTPDRKVDLSKGLQTFIYVYDCTGQCYFVGPNWETMPRVVSLLNARYGWELTPADLRKMVQKWLNMEKDYNKKAGLPEIEPMPKFFQSPLEEIDRTWDISQDELNRFWSNS